METHASRSQQHRPTRKLDIDDNAPRTLGRIQKRAAFGRLVIWALVSSASVEALRSDRVLSAGSCHLQRIQDERALPDMPNMELDQGHQSAKKIAEMAGASARCSPRLVYQSKMLSSPARPSPSCLPPFIESVDSNNGAY